MRDSVLEFNSNIKLVREIDATYGRLRKSGAKAIDLEDLLRSQVVMSVSALDLLIHRIVLTGMISVAIGARPVPAQFRKFRPRLDSVLYGPTTPEPFAWLAIDIREQHALRAFQSTDRISEAIRLIYDGALWPAVAIRLRMPENDMKNLLNLIVQRRNQIVHEFDANPTMLGSRWPINRSITRGNVTFIAKLGRSIVAVVK